VASAARPDRQSSWSVWFSFGDSRAAGSSRSRRRRARWPATQVPESGAGKSSGATRLLAVMT
jgi:hypothetical protein